MRSPPRSTDGVLEFPGGTYRGRDAIRAGLGSRHNSDAPQSPNSPRLTFVRHHLTTSKIDLGNDIEAAARSYFIVYTDIGADHAGVCVDKIGLRDERWVVDSSSGTDRLDEPAIPVCRAEGKLLSRLASRAD